MEKQVISLTLVIVQASEYVLELLNNPQLYQTIQHNMLKDIKERFGSELITDQYEYYYNKMLQ